jgi:hypothetical protein
LIAVIFFLWRDYRREDRLAARIETLEDEQREVLLPLVEKLCGSPHNFSSVAQPVMWPSSFLRRYFRVLSIFYAT